MLIVGIDYNNYASVYSCEMGAKIAYIFTREMYPTEQVVSKKFTVLQFADLQDSS